MILFFINLLALLLSFFVAGILVGVLVSRPLRKAVVQAVKRITGLELARLASNPIIAPSRHLWEAEAVLNPAALNLAGRTHLIYRAIGSDGVSRLGYASSPDGIFFDDRLPSPAYVSQNPGHVPAHGRRYSPMMYPSGGSWGGYEDPRMVEIEGTVYVTFNMFENWALRVGYISIPKEDFLAKRFYHWDGPYVLSHGTRDKNWVLFPERFGGKFAVLHSIIGDTPERVRVEYIEDLRTLKKRRFLSPDPQQVPDQKIAWHVHVRSAGPPPLKTPQGWLVFYHAHEISQGSYKLGAMLLDRDDPTRVLYRSSAPVLEPSEEYENYGKPVVYACGAVVRGGTLFVYYGGADKVVCAATAPLAEFLDALMSGEHAALTPHPLEAP